MCSLFVTVKSVIQRRTDFASAVVISTRFAGRILGNFSRGLPQRPWERVWARNHKFTFQWLKTYIYGIFWGEWTARKTPIQLLLLFLQVMCSWKCFGVLWAPSRGSLRYVCNIDPRSPVPSCIIRRHLVNEFLKGSQEKSVFFIDLALKSDSDGYGQRLFSDHYRTATFGEARYI